jgi:hypothetical protein
MLGIKVGRLDEPRTHPRNDPTGRARHPEERPESRHLDIGKDRATIGGPLDESRGTISAKATMGRFRAGTLKRGVLCLAN